MCMPKCFQPSELTFLLVNFVYHSSHPWCGDWEFNSQWLMEMPCRQELEKKSFVTLVTTNIINIYEEKTYDSKNLALLYLTSPPWSLRNYN